MAAMSKAKRKSIEKLTRAILVERFPSAFYEPGTEKRPLKVGIGQDILVAMPELSQFSIGLALGDYTWGPTYCRNIVGGATRFDLNGEASGVVSALEAEHAANRMRLFEKQKKSGDVSPDTVASAA